MKQSVIKKSNEFKNRCSKGSIVRLNISTRLEDVRYSDKNEVLRFIPGTLMEVQNDFDDPSTTYSNSNDYHIQCLNGTHAHLKVSIDINDFNNKDNHELSKFITSAFVKTYFSIGREINNTLL